MKSCGTERNITVDILLFTCINHLFIHYPKMRLIKEIPKKMKQKQRKGDKLLQPCTLYCIFILHTISSCNTGLKALFNKSNCTRIAGLSSY